MLETTTLLILDGCYLDELILPPITPELLDDCGHFFNDFNETEKKIVV